MNRTQSNDLEQGRWLLAIARETLAADLGLTTASRERPDWLLEPGACFVTLRCAGELRGCIGSLVPYRPLIDDVEGNSRAAAFRDPRFPPLTADELDRVTLEVSLLSPMEPMSFHSEQDVLEQLRPGVDGVLLEFEGHRGTFLPAVWRTLPEPRQFLSKLKLKAHLPETFWSPGIRLQRYTTRSWSEGEDGD